MLTTQQYTELMQDLEAIASELEGQEPTCDFSEDQEPLDMLADFNEIWEDR